MIEKIYDNPAIYRVEIVLPDNPLKYLNCYVLPEGKRPCIIDTGFNRQECWEILKEALNELKIDLKDSDLFVTHLHSDHCGLAFRLWQEGCTIYMNADDYDYFIKTKDGTAWNEMERIFAKEGYPVDEMHLQEENHARIYAPEDVFPVEIVRDGDVLELAGYKFTAIDTPGHTKGHMCLYLSNEEILFSGDHILFDITPNITRWTTMKNSLKEYRNSLAKVKQLQVKTVFPAHRANDKDFYDRICELEKHHDDRLDEVYRIVKRQSGLTAYQIASNMTWSMRGRKFIDFTPSQKWFAMGEALAHIDYLLEENRILKETDNGIYKYYVKE